MATPAPRFSLQRAVSVHQPIDPSRRSGLACQCRPGSDLNTRLSCHPYRPVKAASLPKTVDMYDERTGVGLSLVVRGEPVPDFSHNVIYDHTLPGIKAGETIHVACVYPGSEFAVRVNFSRRMVGSYGLGVAIEVKVDGQRLKHGGKIFEAGKEVLLDSAVFDGERARLRMALPNLLTEDSNLDDLERLRTTESPVGTVEVIVREILNKTQKRYDPNYLGRSISTSEARKTDKKFLSLGIHKGTHANVKRGKYTCKIDEGDVVCHLKLHYKDLLSLQRFGILQLSNTLHHKYVPIEDLRISPDFVLSMVLAYLTESNFVSIQELESKFVAFANISSFSCLDIGEFKDFVMRNQLTPERQQEYNLSKDKSAQGKGSHHTVVQSDWFAVDASGKRVKKVSCKDGRREAVTADVLDLTVQGV